MAIGPVDIEFVLKGDVDEKMKNVSGTVRGEGQAIDEQFRRLAGSGTAAFEALAKSTQMQAVQLQRINSHLDENAKHQERLNKKMEEGVISQRDYQKATAALTTERTLLQQQAANLEKHISKEIEGNLQVAGSINDLTQRLSKLRDEYRNLSDMERSGAIGKQMQQEMKDLAKSIEEAESANLGFLDTLKNAPGPLGQTVSGIERMTRAGLKFIATPIGAVIAAISAALMAVTSWFRRTEEGQNALAKSSGYFKQVLDGLLDVVDKVGKWIYDAFTKPKTALKDLVDFLKGQVIYRFEALGKMASAIGKMFTKDWKEGFNDMANAMLQFQLGVDDAGNKIAEWGAKQVENAKKRAEIEDKLFKLRVEERKVNEDISATEAKIAELRFKGRDFELPEAERLAALREAQQLIEQNYQKEIDIATRRRDLVKEQKELSNSNVEDNEEISQLTIGINQKHAAMANEQRQLMREIKTLTKQVGDASVEGIQALQQELEQLQKKILDADSEQQKIIARRIIELQKELDLRIQIADENLRATRNAMYGSDIVPERMKPVTQNIDESFAKSKEIVKETTIEVEKLRQKIKQNEENVKSWLKAWHDEKLQKFLQTSQQILGIAGHIVDKYKEQLGLTEEQAKVIDDSLQMMSGIADIASGNVVEGVAKMVDSAISMFVKIPEEMNVRFEQLQENIEKVLRSIDIASRSMINLGKNDVLKALGVVNQQFQQVAKSARDLNEELAGKSYGPRRPGTSVYYENIRRDVADLNEEIEKLTEHLLRGQLSDKQRIAIEAVLESYNALVAQIDQITRDLTGTTVGELSDTLANAFLLGIDAAESWGRAVDDIIKRVITQQLTAAMIAGPVQEAIDKLIKDTDGGLTTNEAERFKETIENLAESVAPAFEQARQALESIGIDMGGQASPAGMVGAIRALTEETGGMIYGQLMGIRYDIKEMMSRTERSDEDIQTNLSYMAEIARNTRHNEKLNSIDDRLREMNILLANI
ncbi:MAG: hypothetical protein WC959_12235 [Kiritimatiellales bacterium]